MYDLPECLRDTILPSTIWRGLRLSLSQVVYVTVEVRRAVCYGADVMVQMCIFLLGGDGPFSRLSHASQGGAVNSSLLL